MTNPLHRLAVMALGLTSALSRIAPSAGYRSVAYNPYQKPVYAKRTSRYMPHQGEREMARRRAQMLKAYGRNPVVRFYGGLSGGGE